MSSASPATERPPESRSVVERVQLLLMLAVFVILPWLVSPGRTQPDTKIDLTLSPWRYLGRSLDAWNNHAGLGELQNQAYGYLFPMGPIFGVCRSLGIPAWATQRIWWTVLLVVAFLGAQQLIRRLGVAGVLPAITAGAAYALAPRMLTVLPVISIEAWPMALAPWLVLAVLPLRNPSLSRAALVRSLALAGVLTAALGGVNATASAAVLVLPLVFLLTHPIGRRRLPLWIVAVVLGGLWWLLPLLVLGKYAYPFLDYIETASITTAVTSVPNVLRGADDWIAYILDSADHPVWQGGWVLAQSVTAIIATGLVAAVGCWGLLRGRGHLARWTTWCVVAAVLFMELGHGGTLGGLVSEQVRGLLDGSLAPLRNVHKADPVLRLPLVIGFAATLQRVSVSTRVRDRFLPALLALLVVVAATPMWQGRVGASDSYAAIPKQWTQVAHEIDSAAKESGGSTMLLPNSRTPTYTWGTTTDEPLSALATSPVVTREAAPLGIPGSTRILDAADELAASGVPQPSLAAGLARLGIRRVVLRRNLAPSVRAQPWQQVQRTLRTSPGFRVAASYGSGTSALTVYDVTADPSPTTGTAMYAANPVTVAGGPEALFAMYAAGLLTAQQWMQLTGDPTSHPDVVTDTKPWRAYNNGVPTAFAYSPVLTRDDRSPTRIGAKDLPPATNSAQQPARDWIGWTGVQVSSSAADPFARHYLSVHDGPASAFDGDTGTAWLTGDQQRTAWLQGELRDRRVTSVHLQLAGPAQHATLPESVQVEVGGKRVMVAVRGRSSLTVRVPETTAGTVRVRLSAANDDIDPVLGIVEMRVAGTELGSIIDVPQPVDAASQGVLLTRLPEDRASISRQLHLVGGGALPGSVWLRSTGRSVPSGCGAAGSITVTSGHGTTRIPLQVKGTDQVATGGLVEAATCGSSVASSRWLSSPGERSGGGRIETATLTVSGARGLVPQYAALGHRPEASYTDRVVMKVTGDSGRRAVHIDAGTAGIVSLSEGFNAGWQATDASGHRLRPVEVDGWRQGFRVPASGAQTLTLRFAPTTPQRIGLLLGALAALALLITYLLAVFVCRRHDVGRVGALGVEVPLPQGDRPALRGYVIGVVAAVVVATLVVGPAGIAVGVVAAAVPRRWWRHTAAGALVAACVALAFFGVVDAQSAGAVSGQLFGTLTLAVLVRAGCASAGAHVARPAAPPKSPTPTPPAR